MNKNEFKSIIDFAIKSEVDAYQFYKDASVKLTDQSLKDIFTELAKEELEHREFLEDFASSGMEDISLDEFNDYKISETIDKPELTIEMNFADAIALAIKNEEEAMEMYQRLAGICLDEKQKNLFLGLMKMEQMHKAKLEDIYVNVAFGEVW